MLGTLRGALTARGIRIGRDQLRAEVEGLIEKVGNGIRITTIQIHYTLDVPPEQREEAERAVAVHDRGCPATQSVTPAIKVEWDVKWT
jgi:uncharacterized OsmC-like protein